MNSKKNDLQNNKITSKNPNVENPIKQLHHLDGKYFIVLDEIDN